jgi:hypothetical protein
VLHFFPLIVASNFLYNRIHQQDYLLYQNSFRFLKSIIDQRDGVIGHTEHGRPYFAYYDDKGITKVEVGNPPELYWERKEAGILRPADLKTIKSLQRQIKQLEVEIAEREAGLRDGTYTDRYGVIAQMKDELASKKERINQIQTS